MKKFLKTAWGCLVPLLVYTLISCCTQFAGAAAIAVLTYVRTGSIVSSDVFTSLNDSSVLITFVISILAIPVFAVMMKNDKAASCDMVKPRGSFACILICLLGGIGGCILGNSVLTVTGISQADPAGTQVADAIMNSPLWLVISCVVIGGPLMEEMLFRGLIHRRVKSSWGGSAGIIVSAAMFGIFHGNISQGIYGAFMGVLLSYAFEKTGRFYIPVLMHMSANVMSVLISAAVGSFAVYQVAFAEVILSMMGILAGTALTAVFFIYLHGFSGNRKE